MRRNPGFFYGLAVSGRRGEMRLLGPFPSRKAAERASLALRHGWGMRSDLVHVGNYRDFSASWASFVKNSRPYRIDL